MSRVEFMKYAIGPTRWRNVLWSFELSKYHHGISLIVNIGRWHYLWIDITKEKSG